MSDTDTQVVDSPPPSPPPTPTPTPPSAPRPTPTPTEARFTQAQIDEAASRARNEGRQAAYRYLGKELGVAVVTEDGAIDLSQLRELVTTGRTQKSSDADRLRALLAEKDQLASTIEQKDSEVQGAVTRARHALRQGEAKALAVQLGYQNPADALALLGDLNRFETDLDAGTVAGLEDALKALAEQKPYLLKQAASDVPPPVPPPAVPPTPPPTRPNDRTAGEDDDDKLDSVRAQARSFF